jgi:sulfur carrier protein
VRVLLNGSPQEVDAGTTAAELVVLAGAPPTGVAVALDGAVLPRSRWATVLLEGATVEVLTAVQGG